MRLNRIRILTAAALVGAAASLAVAQTPVDTGWTYQGRLTSGGNPATGNYDLRFTLYSNAAGTTQVGSVLTLPSVAVDTGLFTVKLDFGAQFTGSKRWLKVEVSPAGAGTYTALPLQEISSAPQSLFSENPWTLSGTSLWYAGGNVGIGRANPAYAFDVRNGPGTFIRLGLDGNGGGQLILANNNGDNTIFVEGYNSTGTGSASAMNFTGISGGPIPSIQLNGSLVTMPAPASRLQIGDPTGTDCRQSVVGSSFAAAYFENFGSQVGSNAVRAVITGAPNNSAAVTALNTVAPGAGQLNFGLYATAVGTGQAIRGDAAAGVGVVGTCTNLTGYGGYFINTVSGGMALWADGPMQCKSLKILGGADLAEPFDVRATAAEPDVRPGMVVVIDADHPGELRLADQPYDTRVAGIISGANGLEPGMVMKSEGQEKAEGRYPVAMTGRVWCYADATGAPIRPGDRLTTSTIPGCAMRAADDARAGGAVIGKAMTELKDGKGLVLVLVNLQ